MPKLAQVSFGSGEISPSLAMRSDLQKYSSALKTCRNFFVRATGGISNRAGTQYVAALNADSLATLIPFVFSTEQAYMLVLQEMTLDVYANGAFVQGTVTKSITNIAISGAFPYERTITTSAAHGFLVGQFVTIADVNATGDYAVSGTFTVLTTPTATTFTIKPASAPITGSYVSGGTATAALQVTTDYLSEDLAAIRYTQSADVVTLAHPGYQPSEVVRVSATNFTFSAITDFTTGPFLDISDDGTTMTASAATGSGITLTASASVFTADHIGALVRLDLTDLSGIKPWEASKLLAASGDNPNGLLRRANGKVYQCVTNEVAGADGTYTGTIRPSHDEGIEEDGDGSPIASFSTRSGVKWQYLHSLFGVAKVTAQAGTTATADVLSYIPIVSPATTESWAFGAWSEDQGYPSVVTYFGDRLVFANTPEQPQTEWASRTAEYHDFGESNPLVDDDSITQTLNARQVNAILELVPLDQLVALTASGSVASPQRGESWVPATIGFFPQSNNGSANLRAILVGDYGALFAQRFGTKVRELRYNFDNDKYGGEELTILARHLFGVDKTIVDLDYAAEPYGILWCVLSDGSAAALTYLPEQQVIGWHRHDTDGFFERVCVIPESGRDAVYFVVRRTIGGATVRYLERLAEREFTDQRDGFFVDSGLTYDGRNTTATTLTITGASYAGGASVTLTASSSIFSLTDIDDVIQFDQVRIKITAFITGHSVTGQLQTPVPVDLQATASTAWTFARDTFSGLDHLEGEEVAICADGMALARQTVTGASITLPYAFGVVHIGLPFTAEAETLEVTIFGAETIRDRQKRIPTATVVVQDTVGLQVGVDADHLETLAVRVDEFYTDPTAALSGIGEAYLTGTWQDSGRIVMRQADPLPATILAVLPNVKIGQAA